MHPDLLNQAEQFSEPPRTPKEIVESGNRIAGFQYMQPNWGRVQTAGGEAYSKSLQAYIDQYARWATVIKDNDGICVFATGYDILVPGIKHPVTWSYKRGDRSVDIASAATQVQLKLKSNLEELEKLAQLIGDSSVDEFLGDARTQFHRLKSRFKPGFANLEERELERYDGFVEKIEGDQAFVTLTDGNGEQLLGQYSARELESYGIKEHRRFICRTIELDDEISIVLEPVPDVDVSESEQRRIDEEVEKLLADDPLDGDY